MKQYVLMMRGGDWDSIKQSEKDAIMQRYGAYVRRLKEEGRFKGGNALTGKGRTMKPTADGVRVTDGPFADAKEGLNGYFVIEAENLDDAVRIGQDCPCLTHGETLVVLEVTNN